VYHFRSATDQKYLERYGQVFERCWSLERFLWSELVERFLVDVWRCVIVIFELDPYFLDAG